MVDEISTYVRAITEKYDPANTRFSADALQSFWLTFEPVCTDGIKQSLKDQQETVGIPVPVLKKIGKILAKPATKDIAGYLPLMELLWHEYGREGRVIALIALGKMELKQPEVVVPVLKALCRTCITWEDADRLAMDALEPIVRLQPEVWLPKLETWLNDDNPWLRRVAVIVVGRLPMKHAQFTEQCLTLIAPLLIDEEDIVRKGVSFAIRLCARGDVKAVYDFMQGHVPPDNAVSTWVLCDVIRSMAKRLLSEFSGLLPAYEQWLSIPSLSSIDRRSVESAVRVLNTVA